MFSSSCNRKVIYSLPCPKRANEQSEYEDLTSFEPFRLLNAIENTWETCTLKTATPRLLALLIFVRLNLISELLSLKQLSMQPLSFLCLPSLTLTWFQDLCYLLLLFHDPLWPLLSRALPLQFWLPPSTFWPLEPLQQWAWAVPFSALPLLSLWHS